MSVFTFCCNLFIPVIMLIFSLIMIKHPPKNINGIYGYRTYMSTRSQETWDYAHARFGRIWLKMSVLLLVMSVIGQIPFLKASENTTTVLILVIMTIQMVGLIGPIFVVEKDLKRLFDKSGKRIVND